MNSMRLTKKEAAAHLGVSTKAIERYVRKGQLPSTIEPNEGGGNKSYYQLEDLEKLKHDRTTVNGTLRHTGVGATNGHAGKGSVALVRANKNGRIEDVARLLSEALRRDTKPTVPVSERTFLTVREAAALEGVGVLTIKEAIKCGVLKSYRIPHTRGIRILADDLVSLETELVVSARVERSS